MATASFFVGHTAMFGSSAVCLWKAARKDDQFALCRLDAGCRPRIKASALRIILTEHRARGAFFTSETSRRTKAMAHRQWSSLFE
jgi:hypothetical protein